MKVVCGDDRSSANHVLVYIVYHVGYQSPSPPSCFPPPPRRTSPQFSGLLFFPSLSVSLSFKHIRPFSSLFLCIVFNCCFFIFSISLYRFEQLQNGL